MDILGRHRSTRLPAIRTLWTLALLASTSAPGLAQPADRTVEGGHAAAARMLAVHPSPVHPPSVREMAGRTSVRGTEGSGALPGPDPRSSDSFAETLVISSLGSALGVIAGMAVGFGAEDAGLLIGGVVVGSVVGAGGGVALAGVDGRTAFGGALLGAGAGLWIASRTDVTSSPFITYALVQGLVTTAIAHR